MRDTIDLWHKVWPDPGAFVRASAQDLEQLVALVRADEREACAKVCDEEYFAYVAADAIRNRGNT